MLRTIMLTLALSALAGCAGQRYWHEPPQPAADGADTEIWQGLMRSDALQYYTVTSMMTPVGVKCARYQDLIRIEREGSQLNVSLGREGVVELSLQLEADGRFSTSVPVKGDIWVYGAVMLDDDKPMLHLSGWLDRDTGVGEGQIKVSPGHERVGCPGHFQIGRNAGSPPASELGKAFKIQYWIDELDIHENRL